MDTTPTTPRPTHNHYDAIVVGARAAGAATAMLLARRGLDVLVIDRQRVGADTLSTHALMRGAVGRLAKWGLLAQVLEAGTPTIERTRFRYGDRCFDIDVGSDDTSPGLCAPRRTVLDPILCGAAVEAGAEVLHETRLIDVTRTRGGRVAGAHILLADGSTRIVSAGIVIGADGLRSSVAKAVGARITRRSTHASAFTIRYYDDLDVDMNTFEWLYQPGRGGGIIPTNDGVTCVFTGMPPDEFASARRADVAATHHTNLRRLDPALAERVAAARPASPLRTWPGMRGQFRSSHGPGWALVGDAGYFKDPYAAHGITDAFRDAELLSEAVLDNSVGTYESTRDSLSMPLFGVLDRIASYEWDLDELAGLHVELSRAMKNEDVRTLGRTPVVSERSRQLVGAA